MFVFQTSTMQKPLEQQAAGVRVFAGKDAQRLIQQGIAPACELVLSKVHGRPGAF